MFEIEGLARLYLDQDYVPKSWREEYANEEIYYVDGKLTKFEKTIHGNMWTIEFDGRVLTTYEYTLVPLVYILTKDGDMLSVHSSKMSAAKMIEKIERIDSVVYKSIHEDIIENMVYDSNLSTYHIHVRELYGDNV